jgi:Na+/proline symporter
MTATFTYGDIASIVIYFIVILSIALYHMNKSQGNQQAQRYFLADRSAPWWAVGCSLFASNIGSEHFVGLAGSGAKDGIVVAWGEWGSPLAMLLLTWVFVPFYISSAVFTMPQYAFLTLNH